MIVISDTSPLNYLVLIDLQHILPELFERILIPVAVRDELQSAGAPEAIARFMAAGGYRPSQDIECITAAADHPLAPLPS